MRATAMLGVWGLTLSVLALASGGCCTPRTDCNAKPDPTAAFQVKPAEYQQAMRERASAKATAPASTQPATLQVLVLSGGGSNGSFGAGYLAGWAKTGQRPRF